MSESSVTSLALGSETEFGVMGPHVKDYDQAHAGWDFFEALQRDWRSIKISAHEPSPRDLAEYHIWRKKQHERWLAEVAEETARNEARELAREQWQRGGFSDYLFEPAWADSMRGAMLGNGTRFYLDHMHPEMSTCTTQDPLSLLTWNRANYRFLDRLCKKVEEVHGVRFRIFCNNVGAEGDTKMQGEIGDHKRNSFGYHLNILVDRTRVSFSDLARKSIPIFAFSPMIWGQGKVRCDYRWKKIPYQISQRADFFVCEVSGSTMENRGIVNLRDEPHGDPAQWMRHHIILFDTNMLELPEYLKITMVAVHHMMVQDGVLDDRFEIDNPVRTLHEVSWDTECRAEAWLVNGRKSRLVVDCLRDFADLAWEYLEAYHPKNRILKDGITRFKGTLEKIAARDWEGLRGGLDWVTKKFLIEEMLEKKGVGWDHALADQLDLRYSELDFARGLFWTKIYPYGDVVRIAKDRSIEFAEGTPYPGRSRFMKELCTRYREYIISINFWDCVYAYTADGHRIYIRFDDPRMQWNPSRGAELFALPWKEFLVRIKSDGLASVSLSERLWVSSEHYDLRDEGSQSPVIRDRFAVPIDSGDDLRGSMARHEFTQEEKEKIALGNSLDYGSDQRELPFNSRKTGPNIFGPMPDQGGDAMGNVFPRIIRSEEPPASSPAKDEKSADDGKENIDQYWYWDC